MPASDAVRVYARTLRGERMRPRAPVARASPSRLADERVPTTRIQVHVGSCQRRPRAQRNRTSADARAR
eukprot:2364999-Pyramimonas_sp.AAC.1